MAEKQVRTKGGKKEKKDAPKAPSSNAHKLGIARNFARLGVKKLRRVAKSSGPVAAAAYAAKNGLTGEWKKIEASGLIQRRETAAKRRQAMRELFAADKLQWARARHEAERAERAAQRKAELESEAAKKAKRSAAAKKAAATRAANKAAKQTATA